MKTILSILILMILVGCKKASGPVSQSETHRWIAPAQGAIDVYVNQFTLSPANGSILRPNFTGPSITYALTSTNQKDKPPYAAKISYIGTKDGVDHYSVVITYPVGEKMKSETKEIFYRGSDIEIFRDSEYRIGIRPSTEKRTEANKSLQIMTAATAPVVVVMSDLKG